MTGMNKQNKLSSTARLTVVSLIAATVGVVIQIISGVDFPTIPPVFFILLIPAGLVAFGRWRWTPVIATLAGLFLTIGLFLSGESVRLFDLSQFGGSVGLWVQTLGAVAAAVSGIRATIQNYRSGTSIIEGQPA